MTDWTDIHGRMAILDPQFQFRNFATERDWGQFHTPKNLVMALTGEAGELTEIFQWQAELLLVNRQNVEVRFGFHASHHPQAVFPAPLDQVVSENASISLAMADNVQV